MIVNLYCDVETGKQLFSATNSKIAPDQITVKRNINVEFRIWFRQFVTAEWVAYFHPDGTSYNIIAKKKGVVDGDPAFESTDFIEPTGDLEYYSVFVDTNTQVLKNLLHVGDEDSTNDLLSVLLFMEVSWSLDGDIGAILNLDVTCQNRPKTGDEGSPVGPPSPETKYLQIDNDRFYPSIHFPGSVYDDRLFGYFVPHRTVEVFGMQANCFSAPSGGDLQFRLYIDGVLNSDVLITVSDGAEYEQTIFSTPLQIVSGSVVRGKIVSSNGAEFLDAAFICRPIAP